MSSVRIAFTSCVRYKDFPDQPWWDDIARENPDALVLLGDQIYMDYGAFGPEKNGWPEHTSAANFAATMNQRYAEQCAEPHFRALTSAMRERGRLFAVWDDHDFAWNNACGHTMQSGEAAEKRRVSRELFHRWLHCAPNPPEIYGAVDVGPARLILLDNRSYAEPPGATARLLGEEQWRFVETQVASAPDYVLLCGGITLHKGKENWGTYPRELERLSRLVRGRERVLFVAGDIHDNRFDRADKKTLPCHQAVASGLAINLLGTGWSLFDRHNWGLLDVGPAGITVTLVTKKGREQHVISRQAWFGKASKPTQPGGAVTAGAGANPY